MKDFKQVLIQVEKSFLEKVDEHWKSQGFNTRTQYIMFLIRNDVNETKEEKKNG